MHALRMRKVDYTCIQSFLPTHIRLFKAFKNKDNYVQKVPRKGSVRDWPYVKTL